jgi:hypothetical protein
VKYVPPSFIYCGEFASWADVQAAFATKEPEPEEVYLAWHTIDGGIGEAHVYYRNRRRYYLNAACYPDTEEQPRLRGLWRPEAHGFTGFMAHLAHVADALDHMPEDIEYDLVRAVRHKINKRTELQ